jgi:hypothetical protein
VHFCLLAAHRACAYTRQDQQSNDWNWLFTTYSADVADQAINGYYLNGPGSEDPVKMAALANGVNPDRSDIVYNSERRLLADPTRNATHAAEQTCRGGSERIKSRQKLMDAIMIARVQGFED